MGLEYFSFDVDIFDDEKVIPISSEFGAKGECMLSGSSVRYTAMVFCRVFRRLYVQDRKTSQSSTHSRI